MSRRPNGWPHKGVVHFGIDSMRPGPEGKENLLVHKACFELGITHIESLCNLEALLGDGPVHLHRPADEMARRHRLADPRGRGVRDVRVQVSQNAINPEIVIARPCATGIQYSPSKEDVDGRA